MRLIIGADHAGYGLKEKIKEHLFGLDHQVDDMGAMSLESVDYPDYAEKVALGVAARNYDMGILVCGSGIGMAIAANKIADIRAANCYDITSARLSREHNDANILTLGSRVVDAKLATDIVDTWLNADFMGERHQRRLDKITMIEKNL